MAPRNQPHNDDDDVTMIPKNSVVPKLTQSSSTMFSRFTSKHLQSSKSSTSLALDSGTGSSRRTDATQIKSRFPFRKKKKIQIGHFDIRRLITPSSVNAFDEKIQAQPAMLGRFMIWYIYYDIYLYPSPETWFLALTKEELQGWFELSKFITENPGARLPGLHAVCINHSFPQYFIENMIVRVGNPDRMEMTEFMEDEQWANDKAEIPKLIHDRLLYYCVICEKTAGLSPLDDGSSKVDWCDVRTSRYSVALPVIRISLAFHMWKRQWNSGRSSLAIRILSTSSSNGAK